MGWKVPSPTSRLMAAISIAALLKLPKNLGREMQSGGGRCHSSRMIREDSLVALAIGGIVIAGNVGRQGNMAKPLDGFVDISLGRQADASQAVLSATHYFGGEFTISKFDTLAEAHLPARTNQGFPFLGGNLSG